MRIPVANWMRSGDAGQIGNITNGSWKGSCSVYGPVKGRVRPAWTAPSTWS